MRRARSWAMRKSPRASPWGSTAGWIRLRHGPEPSSETSSSSNPVVLGSTMSAYSAVGFIMWVATAKKSRDLSAARVFGVSG